MTAAPSRAACPAGGLRSSGRRSYGISHRRGGTGDFRDEKLSEVGGPAVANPAVGDEDVGKPAVAQLIPDADVRHVVPGQVTQAPEVAQAGHGDRRVVHQDGARELLPAALRRTHGGEVVAPVSRAELLPSRLHEGELLL